MPSNLTRILRSRHVLALDFVRQYFIDHGGSPSLNEIASAQGISRKHAGRLVHELAADGLIGITIGLPRSITLPALIHNHSTSEILLELMRRGVVVNPGKILPAPANVTQSGLPPSSPIGHSDAPAGGIIDGGEVEEDPTG